MTTLTLATRLPALLVLLELACRAGNYQVRVVSSRIGHPSDDSAMAVSKREPGLVSPHVRAG